MYHLVTDSCELMEHMSFTEEEKHVFCPKRYSREHMGEYSIIGGQSECLGLLMRRLQCHGYGFLLSW